MTLAPTPDVTQRPAPGGATVDGLGGRSARPVLRLVEASSASARWATTLAPTSRAQAVRRRAAVLAVVGVLCALAVAAGARVLAPSPPAMTAPATVTTVVVEPGQTVWDVARTHAPAGVATSEYAARIIERNGLAGGDVDEWQVLRLP